MLFEKETYAVAAVLVVYFGAFEPGTPNSVLVEAPVTVTIQVTQTSTEGG